MHLRTRDPGSGVHQIPVLDEVIQNLRGQVLWTAQFVIWRRD